LPRCRVFSQPISSFSLQQCRADENWASSVRPFFLSNQIIQIFQAFQANRAHDCRLTPAPTGEENDVVTAESMPYPGQTIEAGSASEPRHFGEWLSR